MLYNSHILKDRRKELRKNQTESERIVWNLVRNKQCNGYKFFRQYSVGAFILDLYCPKLRLAIEIDGGQHAEAAQLEYDKQRTAFLAGQNIKELRFWNNDVIENSKGVYQKISEYCNNEDKRGVAPS